MIGITFAPQPSKLTYTFVGVAAVFMAFYWTLEIFR